MEIEAIFKAPALVVGALGGAVGIVLGEKKPKTKREYGKSIVLVVSGAVLTNFLTPLAIKLLPILEGSEHATGFVIGLLGLSVASIIYNTLNNLTKELRSDFWGTISKVKNTFKE